jgi:hypothetical protein
MLSVQGVANASTTLTFDDLNLGSNALLTLPSSYDGFNWGGSGGVVVNVPVYAPLDTGGYSGALVSSPNVLSTADVTISPIGGGTFSFDSAYITGAWRDGQNVAVTGYSGSTVVDSTNLTLGAAEVLGFYTFGWSNISSVSIVASGGTPSSIYTESSIVGIGIDNLTYDTSPVPLPAAAWLLLAGLGGLGVIGRTRPGTGRGPPSTPNKPWLVTGRLAVQLNMRET